MTAMFFCRRAVCVWLPLIAAAILLGAAGVTVALLCVLVADCAGGATVSAWVSACG